MRIAIAEAKAQLAELIHRVSRSLRLSDPLMPVLAMALQSMISRS